jgi:4-carboxymuconolactone decarboxylase
VDESTIAAIRERRAPQGLDPHDALIVQFTQELLRQHRVTDATFRAVQQKFGDAGAVDLLILIGYDWTLSHALSALEADPGVPSTLTH